MLRGHWPEDLTKEQFGRPDGPRSGLAPTRCDRRARHAVIGETVLRPRGRRNRRKGQKTAARASDTHFWPIGCSHRPIIRVWRLEGELHPFVPAPAATKTTPATNNADGARRRVRLQSGGELRAPAIELVETAKALGKLDELVTRVDGIKLETDSDRAADERGKAAPAGPDPDRSRRRHRGRQGLETIKTQLDKRPNRSARVDAMARDWCWPRAPLSGRRSAHRLSRYWKPWPARSRRSRTTGPSHNQPPGSGTTPESTSAAAQGFGPAEKAGRDAARPFGTDPGDSPSARVTPTTAESRGLGEPIPHWSHPDGDLTHYPGHVRDLLYLNVPLRGDFQLDCELTSSTGRKFKSFMEAWRSAPRPT